MIQSNNPDPKESGKGRKEHLMMTMAKTRIRIQRTMMTIYPNLCMTNQHINPGDLSKTIDTFMSVARKDDNQSKPNSNDKHTSRERRVRQSNDEAESDHRQQSIEESDEK
eukprot:687877_1